MKVTAVYGTERKGCSWHIAQQVLSGLQGADVTAFYLPRDCPDFCVSCMACFTGERAACSQSENACKILNALLEADVIVLTSPVYVYHLSGAMKAFLDHYGSIWMVHRPREEMFRKRGVVIATAAGPVFRKTLHEMKDSLDFGGVAKTYSLGTALMQTEWDKVSPKIRNKVGKKAAKIAQMLHGEVGGTVLAGAEVVCAESFYAKAFADESGGCGLLGENGLAGVRSSMENCKRLNEDRMRCILSSFFWKSREN